MSKIIKILIATLAIFVLMYGASLAGRFIQNVQKNIKNEKILKTYNEDLLKAYHGTKMSYNGKTYLKTDLKELYWYDPSASRVILQDGVIYVFSGGIYTLAKSELQDNRCYYFKWAELIPAEPTTKKVDLDQKIKLGETFVLPDEETKIFLNSSASGGFSDVEIGQPYITIGGEKMPITPTSTSIANKGYVFNISLQSCDEKSVMAGDVGFRVANSCQFKISIEKKEVLPITLEPLSSTFNFEKYYGPGSREKYFRFKSNDKHFLWLIISDIRRYQIAGDEQKIQHTTLVGKIFSNFGFANDVYIKSEEGKNNLVIGPEKITLEIASVNEKDTSFGGTIYEIKLKVNVEPLTKQQTPIILDLK